MNNLSDNILKENKSSQNHDDSVINLSEENDILQKQISVFFQNIKINRQQIADNNNIIRAKCNHNWVPDRTVYDHKTQYICTICHLDG
jgi:hypothetical protein